jgi:ATP-dependent protease ClpP protease subunit
MTGKITDLDITPENEEMAGTRPYAMFLRKAGQRRVFDIYIYNEILEPIKYCEMCDTIRKTRESDEIHIHICTCGGDFNTLCGILHALESTDALVVTHVSGEASSCGAILACYGDRHEIFDYSSIFFHNVQMSSGTSTDTTKVLKEMINLKSVYRQLVIKYCSNILTQQEIEDVCNSEKDLYLSGRDFKERLAKLEQHLNEKD